MVAYEADQTRDGETVNVDGNVSVHKDINLSYYGLRVSYT
jgi:hypothetical protein